MTFSRDRRLIAYAGLALLVVAAFFVGAGVIAVGLVLAAAWVSRWATAAGAEPVAAAQPASGDEEDRTGRSSMTQVVGQGQAVVDLIGKKGGHCATGLQQVRSILGDAVLGLQGGFTTLSEYVATEGRLVSGLADGVARQMDSEVEDSFVNLAVHLKDVFGTAIAMMERMTARAAEAVSQFDEMERSTATMLDLLRDARDIRSETTMLAFNAAIEAARAGVHGETFGAVATEVRSLSGKSQAFNDQLAELTQTLQESIGGTRDAIVGISECDFSAASQSMSRLDGVIHSIEVAHDEVRAGLEMLGETQRRVSSQVGDAIRALQFEDMARQRLEVVERELEVFAATAEEIWQQVKDEVEAHGGETTIAASLSQDVKDKLDSIADSEAVHVPVAASDMNEGEVELF